MNYGKVKNPLNHIGFSHQPDSFDLNNCEFREEKDWMAPDPLCFSRISAPDSDSQHQTPAPDPPCFSRISPPDPDSRLQTPLPTLHVLVS